MDVGSVPRGNKCDCICLSCKTPLVARQGKIREWHFAHRSKLVHSETKDECKYSFELSVRLMIRQLAEKDIQILLPDMHGKLFSFFVSGVNNNLSYKVTSESIQYLEKVEIGKEFCGVPVDVYAEIKGVSLVIYITYKGRNVPIEIRQPIEKDSGVLQLNIDSLTYLFKKTSKGNYKEALINFLKEDTQGKQWIYHPREDKARKKAEQQLTELKEANKFALSNSVSQKDISKKIFLEIKERNQQANKNFLCIDCNTKWQGISSKCISCGKHLYVREVN